jgi:serine/threonine protein kinase
VKLYGKLHFLKRLRPEYVGDIRYQEALRKEFETGYQLEHPNLVRYISLDADSILMEYVDGETLTQRLATHPDYFKNRKNADRFVRQLLDAISYLHSHQVLHLDLKPDNILLTHIDDDVKLIDLGFCRSDAFVDTQGYTSGFAAPEQFAGGMVDARTDIYAVGKILERLPDHRIYNKVIARCTAIEPAERYQSIEEIRSDINRRQHYSRYVAAIVAIVAIVGVGIALLTHREQAAPVIQETPVDSVVQMQDQGGRSRDSVRQNHGPVPSIPLNSPKLRPGETVVLNTADTTALKTIPGIGPYYARKIVQYGQRLGGYVNVDQLDEIEDFPSEVKSFLVVCGAHPQKLNLNKLSLNELKRHPYITFFMARAITDYRRLHGPLHSLSDLRL